MSERECHLFVLRETLKCESSFLHTYFYFPRVTMLFRHYFHSAADEWRIAYTNLVYHCIRQHRTHTDKQTNIQIMYKLNSINADVTAFARKEIIIHVKHLRTTKNRNTTARTFDTVFRFLSLSVCCTHSHA